MIKRYRKITPTTVEAVQWCGNNKKEVTKFCKLSPFVKSVTYVSTANTLLVHMLDHDFFIEYGDYVYLDGNSIGSAKAGDFFHFYEEDD